MTFQSATLDRDWDLGDRVTMSVDTGVRRQYTVCALHRARGVFEVLGVAHEGGPGGRWVRKLAVGDVVALFGPKADLDARTAGAQTLVLLGDETALGLYEAVNRLRRGSASIRGALEHGAAVNLQTCELPVLAGLGLFPRDEDRPGAALHHWIREQDIHTPQTVFFVNGHGAAVRSLRLALISMGVRGVAIRSRAFWGRA